MRPSPIRANDAPLPPEPAVAFREPSPALVEAVAACAEPSEPLTSRERAALRSLVRGHDNRRLAAELGCGEKTAEAHISRLFVKCGAKNRLALVTMCWARWATSEARTEAPARLERTRRAG